MNRLSREEIEYYKTNFPKGTRVMLDYMEDPYPVKAGTKGTVVKVDDIGQIHCNFDDGRTLAICPEVDKFHKIRE